MIYTFTIPENVSTMSSKTTSRDERIDVRVNTESKSLFLRAAELSGQNLSAFIIEAVRERAIQTIEAHDRVVLNNQARQVFLNALANPPAPSEALRRAAEKYAMK
jgi:uncharacterized protein (DUF1778 family)